VSVTRTEAYQRWLDDHEAPYKARRVREAAACHSDTEPLISILLPVYNTPLDLLEQAVESVRSQVYPHWQLCIADDGSETGALTAAVARYCESDSRIVSAHLDANCGIAVATNAALALAMGEFTALLDHDDVLAPEALVFLVDAIRQHPGGRLFYSDSDRLDDQGQRCEPYFKPGWNYELLLGHNYFNHLTAYATDLLRDVGGMRPGFEGSQDYDLALRVTERLDADRIVHLPAILYHWRISATSVTSTRLAEAVASGRRAVEEHLQRRGLAGEVRANPLAVIYNRVRWLPSGLPVSVLVYGEEPELLDCARREIGSAGFETVDAIPTSVEDLETRLREWVARRDAALLCFVRARSGAPATWAIGELARFFSRDDVIAVGTGVSAPETAAVCQIPGSGPGHWESLGAANSSLPLMDREADTLAQDCIVVRREAFEALIDACGDALCLRATMACPGRLLWTPYGMASAGSTTADKLA
jgi:hypothetical protein